VSIAALLVDQEEFEPIHCSEEVLEGLLRTRGHHLFPGFTYFDFRPPIPSVTGTRHPDGVLLATGFDRWWVVEVEVHRHSVTDHIEPQLSALRDGLYGPEAFRYLDRHEGFLASDYISLDLWQPSFLLIVDEATAEIRAAASRCEFAVIECAVFRSRLNRYAVAVNGDRPRRDVRPIPAGVDVSVHDEAGVCLLRPLLEVAIPDAVPDEIVVGDRAVQKRLTADQTSIAVPLAAVEIALLLGSPAPYRLTFDGHLLSLSIDDAGPSANPGGSS
jgi:hypothetical protein